MACCRTADITTEFIFPRQSVVTGKFIALLLTETGTKTQFTAVDRIKIKAIISNGYAIAFMMGIEIFTVNIPALTLFQLNQLTDPDMSTIVSIFCFKTVSFPLVSASALLTSFLAKPARTEASV